MHPGRGRLYVRKSRESTSLQLGQLVAMCERLVPAQQWMQVRADCERKNRQLATSPPTQPQIDMCLMNGREARFTPQQDPLHAGTPALTPGCGGGSALAPLERAAKWAAASTSLHLSLTALSGDLACKAVQKNPRQTGLRDRPHHSLQAHSTRVTPWPPPQLTLGFEHPLQFASAASAPSIHAHPAGHSDARASKAQQPLPASLILLRALAIAGNRRSPATRNVQLALFLPPVSFRVQVIIYY